MIFQGCGGDLQEWVDGINKLLAEEGILKNESRFKDIYVFKHDGLTNLLFLMDDVEVDGGSLAMWRLRTYDLFGGTWLSDYVANKLGGFIDDHEEEKTTIVQKPDCALIGNNGNIFGLMGIASRTLKENGLSAQAKEMCGLIMKCHNYNEALNIIGEYVNIVSEDEPELDDNNLKLDY